MKRYIGTKVINATPMTRLAYNQFRGWALPDDENGNDEGYLVEYTDGGTPNTAAYTGYVSWSPKQQFESAYRERPAVDVLQAYQQRVVDEASDLNEKCEALKVFIKTEKCEALPERDQIRLNTQLMAMKIYLDILVMRIASF